MTGVGMAGVGIVGRRVTNSDSMMRQILFGSSDYQLQFSIEKL